MVQEKRGLVPYLQYLGVNGVLNLPRLLPYSLRIPFVGWLAARVVAPIAGYDKRIRRNLDLVCPELSEAEREKLVVDVSKNAGRFLAEMWSERAFFDRVGDAPMEGPGVADLMKAKEVGRPIIALSAHFGSYDAARAIVIKNGFKAGALYRPMANAYFNESYKRRMEGFEGRAFQQTRRGMAEMVKHLRQGGLLAILLDQREEQGAELTFFGKPAMTTLALAEMALKYDALFLPAFGIRRENGLDFDVVFETPIEHSTPEKMMQEYNDRLEARVRANMDQFLWIHNRWQMPEETPDISES